MKKILIASLAATTIAGASEIRSGAYVGAQVGYGNINAKGTESFSYSAPLAVLGTDNTAVASSASKSGVSFGGQIGYLHVMESNLVVGAELYFGKNTGDVTLTGTLNTANVAAVTAATSVSTLKHTFSFVPTLLIGYKFTHQLMAALKIGANISRFDLSNQYNAVNGGAVIFDPPATGDSHKFTKTGLDVGVRAEYALTDNISVTGDVTYTYFSDSTIMLANPSFQGGVIQDNAATHSMAVKPRFITARLGASYRF